ncbi:hypothetical protein [Heyndrickxia vini]|uniref:Uncharacterized protein n=1 Tax=Heyndrickxia vini TaxID=1476025 RepID=A0ABX7E353_9BACI|nr:hypothetical protein [Heyndrickxia vini]QQZ10141.1 hypothetical protein I5776_04045 [Heyndrickxia vini]
MRMQRASKRRRKSKFLILFIVLIAIIGGYCAYQQIAEFKAGKRRISNYPPLLHLINRMKRKKVRVRKAKKSRLFKKKSL